MPSVFLLLLELFDALATVSPVACGSRWRTCHRVLVFPEFVDALAIVVLTVYKMR